MINYVEIDIYEDNMQGVKHTHANTHTYTCRSQKITRMPKPQALHTSSTEIFPNDN